MNLPYRLFLLSAATISLSSLISGCTQTPSSAKKETSAVSTSSEESGRLILVQQKPDTLKGSLKAEVQGKIGSATVKISYHSPAVRGRVVWGGLVPFDQVWVSGAHKATSIETDRELNLGGKQLPAGKYALFTMPGKTEWIIIINKNWQQHLTDNYSAKEDLVRLSVKPQIGEENQERLRYEIIAETKNSGQIVLTWEKLKMAVPIMH